MSSLPLGFSMLSIAVVALATRTTSGLVYSMSVTPFLFLNCSQLRKPLNSVRDWILFECLASPIGSDSRRIVQVLSVGRDFRASSLLQLSSSDEQPILLPRTSSSRVLR